MLTIVGLEDGLANIARLAQEVFEEAGLQAGPKSKYTKELAALFATQLRQNIIQETFAGGYTKYTTEYQKWKDRKTNKGFWRLNDDLLNSIVIYQEGNGWYSGISPGATNEGGKDIATYAGYGELGAPGNNQVARPVFGPTLALFMDEYERKGRLVLDKMVVSWRKGRGFLSD